jgi:hypothetical protein
LLRWVTSVGKQTHPWRFLKGSIMGNGPTFVVRSRTWKQDRTTKYLSHGSALLLFGSIKDARAYANHKHPGYLCSTWSKQKKPKPTLVIEDYSPCFELLEQCRRDRLTEFGLSDL